ncbi:glutamate--tRNA ligase [Arsenicicoccus sp. oral taxon 190]|uniref:glutamate--tRNA ligase n=1 Tax=Arsenicicoccus sp. oral taxon 190 TaxID=1658671 RepID=UPI00067A20D5|nr:glutamate--tRNA ligase [Arsenicicoccus sp. oral taxon 190]AKT52287.1 glutamyl-tRNA synthetase [Arsenicicoccus sp. oral taxon 190]
MTDAALTPARTRVAPSPTGDPHVGTAYMALFDLAWARKTGGRFVLRIEDTDQARYVEGSEQQIYDTLGWLGLSADEGPDVGGPYAPYRQSERLDTYKPYVDQLVEAGHAYYCWCSTERLAEMRDKQQKLKLPTGYDRLCVGKTREERAALPGFTDRPVVRMLIPDDVETRFEDVIRGWVSAPRPDDQVILKADGFPTYHLAVVVDDHLMGITTVVRGEEWISSTPKHVLLYRWLGWEVPQFAHMPLLRNPDKSKISKRKNPAARLTWFREEGYLPEALVNFLQLVGYPPVADGQEVSTFEEFVETFDWTKVNTVGPIFDMDKLNWLNGHYIRALSPEDLAGRIAAHLVRTGELPGEPTPEQMDLVTAATPLVQERMQLLKEAGPMLGFLFVADEELTFDPDAVAALKDDAPQVLDATIAALEGLHDFTAEPIQAALRAAIVDGLGIKPKFAFAPARVAVTGRRISPPLFESMEILGRHATLARLRRLRATL